MESSSPSDPSPRLTPLIETVEDILQVQRDTGKPLAIIVAGHNGSGKSTMWRRSIADTLRMPLVNADRMMLSILTEPDDRGHLVSWAATLRDTDRGWMTVAQQGVQAFVGHAIGAKVPFAMETVFSHWEQRPDGRIASKIDLIRNMQEAGYFVLLLFVGLANVDLSVFRVATRVLEGGHGIPEATLRKRFPKTQKAISEAVKVADGSILVDNSRGAARAFTVCRVQVGARPADDVRDRPKPPRLILDWLDIVSPRPA